MTIVCDTNVLISGLFWHGTPSQIICGIENGGTLLFISDHLVKEFSSVICRPKFLPLLKASNQNARDLIRWLATYAVVIMPKPLGRTIIRDDPSDDAVLACAATARVDCIVSGDGHLLQLHQFRGIPILSPSEYMERIGTTSNDADA